MRIARRITSTAVASLALLITACAAPGDPEEPREESAIVDFIEVNELPAVDKIRTMEQLTARDVNDSYVIVSTRRQDYLLEYHSRCYRRDDGRVEPDVRRDSRALYSGLDTFRGCRIKAIYKLEPGQADELRQIGRATRR
ncbi:MAG: hypothetical protein EX272_14185 [Chromatiales bacterium]|nr:MAG: hypothetical protein EX272_14185 [Chromatiales bacterium]